MLDTTPIKVIAVGSAGNKMKSNIKVENNILILKKKLSNDETYKVRETEKMFSVVVYKRPAKAIGVSSMCEDGKHILMIDWDNVCKWVVEQDINYLIEKFKLPHFHLFKTKEEDINNEFVGNYSSWCLAKFYPSEIVDMQRETHCDSAYVTMPLRTIFRSWILRTSGKDKRPNPIFDKIIESPYDEKEISSAHLGLLSKLYLIPKREYKKKDSFTKLFRKEYETGNF